MISLCQFSEIINNISVRLTKVFRKLSEVIFTINGKTYYGQSAVGIVRDIALDSIDYAGPVVSIRQFLLWSLEQQRIGIPPRELNLSERLGDEPLALSYLCLLDEYDIGSLSATNQDE